MKHGDFTSLAKAYINRPAYSLPALRLLAEALGAHREGFRVADVGAGTGKLTEQLTFLGLHGYAVEPNDAMREEAIHIGVTTKAFTWSKGMGEQTGLPDNSVDWVLMASAFHWTDRVAALREFARILKPGGSFTALWNPRHIERSETELRVREIVANVIPNMKRVSSGSSWTTEQMVELAEESGVFEDVIYIEAPHEQVMSKERYMNAWRSVNDIQVQAGPEGFEKIMQGIENTIAPLPDVRVPYRTRAWVMRVKSTNNE